MRDLMEHGRGLTSSIGVELPPAGDNGFTQVDLMIALFSFATLLVLAIPMFLGLTTRDY